MTEGEDMRVWRGYTVVRSRKEQWDEIQFIKV